MKVRGRIHTNIFHLMNRLAVSSVLIVIKNKKEKRNKSCLSLRFAFYNLSPPPKKTEIQKHFEARNRAGSLCTCPLRTSRDLSLLTAFQNQSETRPDVYRWRLRRQNVSQPLLAESIFGRSPARRWEKFCTFLEQREETRRSCRTDTSLDSLNAHLRVE